MASPVFQESRTAGLVRQLAAIMFTDMTGYTALMQDDERRAKEMRDRQRKALQTHIPEFNGRIIQYFGDGTLSLFPSAVDAVKAAIQIQEELLKEPKVLLRIGVHIGDVSYDDEGVYGDCVNLASRIESLAVPGSVLVSDKVYDEIKNQRDIGTSKLGAFNLKNVKRPVEVFAISNGSLVKPSLADMQAKNMVKKTIAVLPFVNMSADPENEYFSDGISEEILNALTKVDGVQVTARSSSFSFKGKNEDVRQIGAKLGVSTVLTGSCRKAGKRMRITAQLINTVDGYMVWSETYDSDLEDIFEVQDEISLKILNKLKENFAEKDQQHLIKQQTNNIEAYNLFLKGLFHWNKSNPEEITKAISCFEEAMRMDPKYSYPYSALSYCYSYLGSAGLIEPTIAYPKAKDFTLKAIEIDPNNAEAYLSLAAIQFYHNWDFEGAEQSLAKAKSLHLNSSLYNQIYGWFLIAKGDFNLAIEKMEQALILDPLSLPLIVNLGDAYAFAGRYDAAQKQFEKAIEMDGRFRRAFESLGMLYLAKGEYHKAIEYLEIYHKLVNDPLKGLSTLGHAYAAAGMHDKAEDCLKRLKLRQEMNPGICLHMDFAFLYAGMKDLDNSFEYLNKTYENRVGIACLGMIFCIRYPLLKQLRTDVRFKQLTERIGIAG